MFRPDYKKIEESVVTNCNLSTICQLSLEKLKDMGEPRRNCSYFEKIGRMVYLRRDHGIPVEHSFLGEVI